MMRARVITSLAFALALTAATSAGEPALTTELVTNDIPTPIDLTHAPGDTNRLFVISRSGTIHIIQDGQVLSEPFLDISAKVDTTFEGGLLGLTFHPDYPNDGRFFVDYTTDEGGNFRTRIESYTVSKNDPDQADHNSAVTLLEVDQPASNHNAGWIDFSPNDGYLYVSFGDGGGFSGGSRAQDITNQLLGKMLRIDVNGDDFPGDDLRNYAIPPDNPFVGVTGDDEIWALGLRNPFRDGFDRKTGDLWIADVGAGLREEVNFQPASSAGGENYGWDCMEGFVCNSNANCTCPSDDLTLPVHDYTHSDGCAITGGTVYRGCAIPELQGTYFFGDYCSARIWSFRYDGSTMTDFQERTSELDPPGGSIDSVVAFGEDAYGELYICDLGGEIYKIIPEDPPADSDGDGIPDSCEATPGDLDGDGVVGVTDLLMLLKQWGPCPEPPAECPADLDGSGDVGVSDLLTLLGNWG